MDVALWQYRLPVLHDLVPNNKINSMMSQFDLLQFP